MEEIVAQQKGFRCGRKEDMGGLRGKAAVGGKHDSG